MSGFFVLDVPEFQPLMAAALRHGQCRAHAVRAGYHFVEFDGEVRIARAETGMTEALWFGCLTAGLEGRIAAFDSQHIHLVATNAAVPGTGAASRPDSAA